MKKIRSPVCSPTTVLVKRVHQLAQSLTPTTASSTDAEVERERIRWPDYTLLWKQITEPEEREEVIRAIEGLPTHPVRRMLCEHLSHSKYYRLQHAFELKVKVLLDDPRLTLGTEKIKFVITVSEHDLDDVEVIEAIAVVLLKYKPEHCIIRCSTEGIIQAFNPDKGGTAHTLIAIGHGFEPEHDQLYYLGPYQARYSKLAVLFSDLIKQCGTIMHIKLLACHYGFVNPKFPDKLAEFNEHKVNHSFDTGRTSATVLWNTSTQKILPFSPESLASLIWKRLITREKKPINNIVSLTASPNIINPVLKKSSAYSDKYLGYFIGCDTDHYGTTTSAPIWSDPSARKISHTKSIRLVYMP